MAAYWKDANLGILPDVTRYKIDVWDNFHPEGIRSHVAAPATGIKEYDVTHKVEIHTNKDGKLIWRHGQIMAVSDKKNNKLYWRKKSNTKDKVPRETAGLQEP